MTHARPILVYIWTRRLGEIQAAWIEGQQRAGNFAVDRSIDAPQGLLQRRHRRVDLLGVFTYGEVVGYRTPLLLYSTLLMNFYY